MAQALISTTVTDVMDRLGAAALAGLEEVEPDTYQVVKAPALPPVGEQCDSVMIWLAGLAPIVDEAECSLIWDASINLRLDICVGTPEPSDPSGLLVSAAEQEARTEWAIPALWALVAGLTKAWREDEIPYPGMPSGCRKLSWGPVLPAVEEGGFITISLTVNVEVSAAYAESS